MNYWDFSLPPSRSGGASTSGVAHVADSRHPELEEVRVYGYLLARATCVVPTARTADPLTLLHIGPRCPPPTRAIATSRATPSTTPTARTSRSSSRHEFSFLIDDFLNDEDFFGGKTHHIQRASKTAIIAAYLLAQREGVEVLAASAGNRQFVEGLAVYDSVVAYDEIDSLPGNRAVYVDISGDGGIRAAVHNRYGDRLAHSAAVGAYPPRRSVQAQGLTSAQPAFAPTATAPRRLGHRELDEKSPPARPFAEWASGWLCVERISSEDDPGRSPGAAGREGGPGGRHGRRADGSA